MYDLYFISDYTKTFPSIFIEIWERESEVTSSENKDCDQWGSRIEAGLAFPDFSGKRKEDC